MLKQLLLQRWRRQQQVQPAQLVGRLEDLSQPAMRVRLSLADAFVGIGPYGTEYCQRMALTAESSSGRHRAGMSEQVASGGTR